MFQFRPFDALPNLIDGIEASNPWMVDRIRHAADSLSHYEISAHLANAITGAADATHLRRWEESQFGEASADALVDAEYHHDLAAAWSLVAAEHQLLAADLHLALGGSGN